MYTPFVVAVGSIIDTDKNKNIEVRNGKVIDNGDKAIVAGIVMPGLEESLNLTGELADIEIPSNIEITMDSTDFEMKNIMSYASPRIIEKDINWSKLDDLFDKANLLKTSIDGFCSLFAAFVLFLDISTSISNISICGFVSSAF